LENVENAHLRGLAPGYTAVMEWKFVLGIALGAFVAACVIAYTHSNVVAKSFDWEIVAITLVIGALILLILFGPV